MILNLLIGIAVISGLVGVYGFVQFARYRMKEDERKEEFYKSLHYIALFILFVVGVIIMLYMGSQPDE